MTLTVLYSPVQHIADEAALLFQDHVPGSIVYRASKPNFIQNLIVLASRHHVIVPDATLPVIVAIAEVLSLNVFVLYKTPDLPEWVDDYYPIRVHNHDDLARVMWQIAPVWVKEGGNELCSLFSGLDLY